MAASEAGVMVPVKNKGQFLGCFIYHSLVVNLIDPIYIPKHN